MLLYCIIMDTGKLHSTTISSYVWPTITSTTNIYVTKKKKMQFHQLIRERERERKGSIYVWLTAKCCASGGWGMYRPAEVSDLDVPLEVTERGERGQGGVREDKEGWERAERGERGHGRFPLSTSYPIIHWTYLTHMTSPPSSSSHLLSDEKVLWLDVSVDNMLWVAVVEGSCQVVDVSDRW